MCLCVVAFLPLRIAQEWSRTRGAFAIAATTTGDGDAPTTAAAEHLQNQFAFVFF